LGFCANHFRRLLCGSRDNDCSTAFRAVLPATSPFVRGTQLRGTRKTDERYWHESTPSLPEPGFRCRLLLADPDHTNWAFGGPSQSVASIVMLPSSSCLRI